MTDRKKIAVVLFNLGGPDSKNALRPFLMNFFMDRNIIRVPVPLRCLIAWTIARRRSQKEAKDSYGEIGSKSPLLENSKKQASKLEEALNTEQQQFEFKTFICMRYWHPMAGQVVREVRDWGADEVLLLPLYPQFSTTTTWSSYGAWNKAMYEAGYERPTSFICCYPRENGFISASATLIAGKLQKAKIEGHKAPRVLFSAHGLPEKVIKDGDPYQWQCEETAKAILAQIGIPNLDWTMCYQSRVGPQKWIGPSTEDELERAAKDGKAVIIYPHAFTQEHVETLVELGIEYRHKAEELGIKGYYVVPTVGTHPDFITGLKDMVLKHTGHHGINAEDQMCPMQFAECCMRGGRSQTAFKGA